MKKRFDIIAVFALLLPLLLACLPQPGRAAAVRGQEGSGGVILAVGDSLTAGLGVDPNDSYPAQLQRRLDAQGLPWRVVNSGVSGETSSGTLSRLNWLLTMKPDIVILETGANDGLRGIDPGLTLHNILAIIAELQKRKIVTVLAGMRMVGNLGSAYTSAFAAIYPEAARKTGVILMPFFLEGVAADPALNNSDGIHPNKHGYAIVVDHLYPYLMKAIAERAAP